ncbi:MAG TPA: tail fiber domain-containing protein [Bacteroidales bacterium]|nr:tail fiber domain-containing protein [Bacteroidales bacterium]HRW86494.1 tail fiber domain-containing protein [Bacteroidales bacterium]
MKTKICFSFILLFVFYLSTAQVPQGFNYQAIARDGSGNPITATPLQVRLTVQSLADDGTIFWQELHPSVTTNSFGLFTIVAGTGTRQPLSTVPQFSDINWKVTPKFLKTEIYYNNSWKVMGSSQLFSVPYAMVADSASGLLSGTKLSVKSDDDLDPEALFEVKRKDGQTVFAVYPDAVNVYVPRSGKGLKGGFAVGGFDATKAEPQDYLRVTPDSVRIYIDPNPAAKGVKGGFAVGGYDVTKGINDMYFNLTGATDVNTVDASPQILWYPRKNAFIAGNVHIGHVDSVGDYSTALGYQSRAIGNYSQAFGYKATAFGDYSTSIGKKSVAGVYKSRHNAFAFGNAAAATGDDSYALGSGAKATGSRSFAFGSVGLDDDGNPTATPTTASSSYTVAIGMGAQATGKGGLALGIGAESSGGNSNTFGYYSKATNIYATAISYKSEASGSYSTAIGPYSKSVGNYSSAFGRNAIANGLSSVAAGYGATTGADAASSIALGYGSKSNGPYSTALGYNAEANGEKSISIGAYYNYTYLRFVYDPITRRFTMVPTTVTKYNIANDTYSVAVGNGNTSNEGGLTLGSNNTARKIGAVAIGHTNYADSAYSFAAGANNYARGYNSFAMGESVYAEAANSFVIGYNNIRSTSYKRDEWVPADPLFVIGNGGEGSQSDAMVVAKNGNTTINGDLTVSGALKSGGTTLTIDPLNARIGINNISPSYSLDVTGNLRVSSTGRFEGDVSLSSTSPALYLYDSDLDADDFRFEANTDALAIWSQGKFSYKLLNVTSAGIISMPYVYGATVGTTYRDLYIDNTGKLGYVSSSMRYKKNITDAASVDWLYGLRPVNFEYNQSTDGHREYGLIAEEVLLVNPDMVSFNENGLPETVSYSSLITPILKAVQDQKVIIETLKAENDDLRQRLEKLESLINEK